MIKIDDHITKFVMDNFDVFQNVHPNVITIVGIILNYFILVEVDSVQSNEINGIYFGILMLFRFLADCLDGAVARKYKKTSKLGNTLDTISDMMLMFVGFYFFMVKFNLPNWWIAVYILTVCWMEKKYSVFTSHEIVKNAENNTADLIMNFFSNNTIIIFVIFFIVVMNENNKLNF
jgi:phosphatidylglycerophosphate synthase